MTLWRGLKKLGDVKIDMSLDCSSNPNRNDVEIFSQLKCFFESYRSTLSSLKGLHFVDCQKDDVDRICRVIV